MELVENLHPDYIPCRFLHTLQPFLLWEKVKIFDKGSDKGFALNHAKSLQIYFSCVFVCVEVLRPSQPTGVMSSAVSLPNHTFTGQA